VFLFKGNYGIKELDRMATEQELRSKKEIEELNEKSNFIGKILLVVGFIIVLIFIVATIVYDMSYWSGIIWGLIVVGFGEIIELLQKIYVNTKK